MRRAPTLVVLAVCVAMPLAARADDAAFRRTLRVNGHGEATAVPDIARVQIGVTTETATAQEALSQNTRQMNELVARVRELGVAAKDVATSGFSIGPRYARDGHSIVGYQVANGVTVTIRDISKAGPLLDKVVSAGANQVSGISFDVSDPTALLTEARKKAVADAHAKAEELAAGAGTRLGPVLTIEEGGGGPIPRPMRGMQVAYAASSAGPPPIEPGESTLDVDVTITYEIE
jgi:uncharacterized protein YggE